MTYRQLVICALILFGLLVGWAGPGGAVARAEGLSDYRSLAHGQMERRYKIYLPKINALRDARPALFALHGGTGTADSMVNLANLAVLADREGFIIVYPEAEPGGDGHRNWNDGRSTTDNGVDDVGFLRALADHVAQNYPVDPSRIYVAGPSNGGFMSQRLACEASDVFAAFAPVIATMPEGMIESCRPKRPVPMLIIAGTADPFVPWAGGEVRAGRNRGRGGRAVSMDRVIDYWRGHNQCNQPVSPEVVATATGRDPVTVIRHDYPGCAAGVPLVLYELQGGGHRWPGGNIRMPGLFDRILGPDTTQLIASEVIWEFVRGHRLP